MDPIEQPQSATVADETPSIPPIEIEKSLQKSTSGEKDREKKRAAHKSKRGNDNISNRDKSPIPPPPKDRAVSLQNIKLGLSPSVSTAPSSASVPVLNTPHNYPSFSEIIELNVGGTFFTTTLSTLRKYPNSFLGRMFIEGEGIIRDSAGRYFIDRDPGAFAVALDYLRTGKVSIPQNVSMAHLLEECNFYNIEGFDLSLMVNNNVAETFRNTNLKAVRPSFEKLWPILQKRMKMVLEVNPTFAAEIEWGHKGGTHNTVHRVEALHDADWVTTKSYIKIEISWKEEEVLRPSACVEAWSKFLIEYGFRTQPVDHKHLRLFW